MRSIPSPAVASEAEVAINREINAAQDHMSRICARREKEVVIEIVRSLDYAAFGFVLAPNRADLVRHDLARHCMMFGASTALRPFLRAIAGQPGGVPWHPSIRQFVELTDSYLAGC
jgi:hypothetical protein